MFLSDEFVNALGVSVANPVAFGDGWKVTGGDNSVSSLFTTVN